MKLKHTMHITNFIHAINLILREIPKGRPHCSTANFASQKAGIGSAFTHELGKAVTRPETVILHNMYVPGGCRGTDFLSVHDVDYVVQLRSGTAAKQSDNNNRHTMRGGASIYQRSYGDGPSRETARCAIVCVIIQYAKTTARASPRIQNQLRAFD